MDYQILNIDLIVKELRKNNDIKNVVIVPHRELHRLPMHVFFENFYNISYLPSLKLGTSLSNRMVPSSGLLSAHPNNTDSRDLLNAYAESTGIGLRYNDDLLKTSKSTTISLSDPTQVISDLENNINHNLLHFLGHSAHDFEEPANSSLILSKDKRITLKKILDDLDLSN